METCCLLFPSKLFFLQAKARGPPPPKAKAKAKAGRTRRSSVSFAIFESAGPSTGSGAEVRGAASQAKIFQKLRFAIRSQARTGAMVW